MKRPLELIVFVVGVFGFVGWCAALAAGGTALGQAIPAPDALRGVFVIGGTLGGLALALWIARWVLAKVR